LERLPRPGGGGADPGLAVVLAGVAFHGAWIAVAVATWFADRRTRAERRTGAGRAMG
jgi:hypothetical protein